MGLEQAEAVVAALGDTSADGGNESVEKPEVGGSQPDGNEGSSPVEGQQPEVQTEGAEGQTQDSTGNENTDPNALPEEVAKLPQVQVLQREAEVAQKFKDLLVEGYEIATETQDGKPRPVEEVLNDLRLERQDAHTLYDVVNGKKDAGAFIDMLLDPKLGYGKDTATRVFTQLVNQLARVGFVQEYIAASGLKLVTADASGTEVKPDGTPQTNNDPRLARLEGELARQREVERQRNEADEASKAGAEKAKVEQAFVGEVERLCKDKGLDQQWIADYMDGIAKKIAGNPAVIKRIAKANFVDVQKYFTEYHNSQIERVKKYNAQLATSKASIKSKVPKAPAGGSTPAGEAPKKRSFANAEDRVRAVTEALNE
jgi:hypothetical protein